MLSTTGGPFSEAEVAGIGSVVLLRTNASLTLCLPHELRLGDGCQIEVSLGRHEANDAVLPMRTISNVHFQVALRRFKIPGSDDKVHEAAFLRDVSRHATHVNGRPAYRPWQWLMHDDEIGVLMGAEGGVCVYKVQYRQLRTISGQLAASASSLSQLPPMLSNIASAECSSSVQGRSSATVKAGKASLNGHSAKDAVGRGAKRKLLPQSEEPNKACAVTTIDWLGCDLCFEWRQVDKQSFKVFKDGIFSCSDLGLRCKKGRKST